MNSISTNNVANDNDFDENRRRTMSIDRLIDQYLSIAEFEELMDLDNNYEDDDDDDKNRINRYDTSKDQEPSSLRNHKNTTISSSFPADIKESTSTEVSMVTINDTKNENNVSAIRSISRRRVYRIPLSSAIRCLHLIRFRIPYSYTKKDTSACD